jgi:hypothetical protein
MAIVGQEYGDRNLSQFKAYVVRDPKTAFSRSNLASLVPKLAALRRSLGTPLLGKLCFPNSRHAQPPTRPHKTTSPPSAKTR